MALLAPLARTVLGDMRSEAEMKALAVRLGEKPDIPGEHRLQDIPKALAVARSALAAMAAVEQAAPHDDPFKGLNAGAMRALIAGVADRLGRALRQSLRDRTWGLYVLIDPELTAGREPLAVAEAAVRGGARILQLRDKAHDKGDLLPLACALKDLCHENKVMFIMNDDADMARAVDADGLHVGQSDLPVEKARLVLEPHQIVGRSNHSVEEALESGRQGVDQIAVGAIYPTATKEKAHGAGLETLRQVRAAVQLPIVAIGGINADNVEPVIEAGADAVAVISAVSLAADPEQAARSLVERIRKAGGRA
jgi:thiamine-phosphate diphosphorylase